MMRRLVLLLSVCLLLTGCAHQLPALPEENGTPGDTVTIPKVYTAKELIGLSGEEITALFGEDYTAVTPEGDPPYFYYEDLGHVPYRFIGTPDDTVIQAVSSDVVGAEMLDVICVGDSYAQLKTAATALEGYTFRPPTDWYDDGFGVYGWAHVLGEEEQYICYIMNEVLVSYECRTVE